MLFQFFSLVTEVQRFTGHEFRICFAEQWHQTSNMCTFSYSLQLTRERYTVEQAIR